MVVAIPVLAEFLQLCISSDFFDRLLQISLFAAIGMMIFVTFKPIPYGKTYTRGTSLLGLEITDRVAVIIANLPGPVIFLYAQLYYPNGDVTSIPSLLYLGHYVHRTLIYPWFRKTSSKVWPLETLIYFAVTNFLLGITFARGLIFGGTRHHIAIQCACAVVFIACAIVAGVHDYKLCALRRAGDNGYQIPQGLLFTWISGPNYLFELLQWVAYLVFLPFGFYTAVTGIWVAVNVTGRAEANHDAYVKKLFKNGKYPEDRAPYVPFVKNSRYLL